MKVELTFKEAEMAMVCLLATAEDLRDTAPEFADRASAVYTKIRTEFDKTYLTEA